VKNVKELKWPDPRYEIIGAFEELANTEMQENDWIDPAYAHSFWDSIWFYPCDSLIERWEFFKPGQAFKTIGDFLYDKEEAEAIEKYCAFLLELLNEKIGANKPDLAYFNHPEWPKVIKGAKEIYELMKRNNEKYGYDEYLEEFERRERLERQEAGKNAAGDKL